MANDDTLLSKPSVLEKLEEDRRKGDQILEVIFGMMPSKHVCDIFHELGFECEALGGNNVINDTTAWRPREPEESFQGRIAMLVL